MSIGRFQKAQDLLGNPPPAKYDENLIWYETTYGTHHIPILNDTELLPQLPTSIKPLEKGLLKHTEEDLKPSIKHLFL